MLNPTERESFEAFMRVDTTGFSLEREGESYKDFSVATYWHFWQAHAMSTPATQPAAIPATAILQLGSGFYGDRWVDEDTLKAIVGAAQPSTAQTEPGMDYTDAYAGAREDLGIWKRRALQAERDLRAERVTSSRLTTAINAANGPIHPGEPAPLREYPAPTSVNPDNCSQEVFERGVSIGLFDIPKHAANEICSGISMATGAKVDWHYIGGRVHIKALAADATHSMQAGQEQKLPQSEGADYFLVIDPKEGTVEFAYTADLGRSFGHDHIKDAQEHNDKANRWVVRPVRASHVATPGEQASRDAAFEAVRKKLCKLPKYSFIHSAGAVRSMRDATGNWIEFDAVHALFDPVAVDAAIDAAMAAAQDKRRILYTSPVATPQAQQHPDDAAVDALATAMKAKLAKQRAKGYGGWDTDCTQQQLSNMLRDHVDKGDPVDVANFCAFLAARGEGIAAQHQTKTAAQNLQTAIASAFFAAGWNGCMHRKNANEVWRDMVQRHSLPPEDDYWFPFLKARSKAIRDLHAEGKTFPQIVAQLNLQGTEHAKRIHLATSQRRDLE